MQPTIEAELSGVRRSLSALAALDDLSADVREELTAAERALQRVETSWSRVLPYLVADNAAVAKLLRDVAPLLQDDLHAEIDSVIRAQGPAPDVGALNVSAANDRNQILRSLLARALVATPRGEDGARTTVHLQAAACLRQSLDNRPW